MNLRILPLILAVLLVAPVDTSRHSTGVSDSNSSIAVRSDFAPLALKYRLQLDETIALVFTMTSGPELPATIASPEHVAEPPPPHTHFDTSCSMPLLL
jgi:hypothetical protein